VRLTDGHFSSPVAKRPPKRFAIKLFHSSVAKMTISN